jgi:hypothetical protein
MNIPLDDFSGSGATKKLIEIIKDYNEATSKQTQKIINLTWAIVVLTVLMLIGLIIQICISLK